MAATFRSRSQQRQWQRLQRRLRPYRNEDWGRSALIFSPHPDDETLGCGGTIVRKCQAGAAVKVVYLTDGRAANGHLGLIDPAALAQIREREAIAATQVLGVPSQNLQFLRFPDGQLQQHQVAAIQRITNLLRTEQPQEIFLPYRLEPAWIPDHPATHDVVMTALRNSGIQTVVYEYPIWFWYHYPWVDRLRDRVFPQPRGWARRVMALQEAWKALYWGYRLGRDFDCAVDVSACSALKRQALNQHVSQMTQFVADDRWKTVADVMDGEFLERFFQPIEIFYRHPS